MNVHDFTAPPQWSTHLALYNGLLAIMYREFQTVPALSCLESWPGTQCVGHYFLSPSILATNEFLNIFSERESSGGTRRGGKGQRQRESANLKQAARPTQSPMRVSISPPGDHDLSQNPESGVPQTNFLGGHEHPNPGDSFQSQLHWHVKSCISGVWFWI